MTGESEFVYRAGVRRQNRTDLAWVLIGEHGAIELWSFDRPEYDPRSPSFGGRFLGGVEIHSRHRLFDWAPEPFSEHCEYTRGQCWGDGSSLAADRLLPLAFRGHDMRTELHEWYDQHLSPAAVSS